MRPYPLVLPLIGTFSIALAACSRPSSPLAPLAGGPVQSITVTDHSGHSVLITEPADIAFVTSQLASLPTRSEGKVNPEFELTFTPKHGPALHLRLEPRCIGPAVRASDVVSRWYFQDRALYEFFASRMASASTRPGPA
jgi:hypothetical protein